MNYNHNNTCPLCRLESVATRLEAVLAALGVPSLAEIFPASGDGETPQHDLNLDAAENNERAALAQHEAQIHQDYQRRLNAYMLHAQGQQPVHFKTVRGGISEIKAEVTSS